MGGTRGLLAMLLHHDLPWMQCPCGLGPPTAAMAEHRSPCQLQLCGGWGKLTLFVTVVSTSRKEHRCHLRPHETVRPTRPPLAPRDMLRGWNIDPTHRAGREARVRCRAAPMPMHELRHRGTCRGGDCAPAVYTLWACPTHWWGQRCGLVATPETLQAIDTVRRLAADDTVPALTAVVEATGSPTECPRCKGTGYMPNKLALGYADCDLTECWRGELWPSQYP